MSRSKYKGEPGLIPEFSDCLPAGFCVLTPIREFIPQLFTSLVPRPRAEVAPDVSPSSLDMVRRRGSLWQGLVILGAGGLQGLQDNARARPGMERGGIPRHCLHRLPRRAVAAY